MTKHLKYKLPKPDNYNPNSKEHKELFEVDAEYDCFAPYIKDYKDVRISTNSVIFNYFKVFEESCISQQNFKSYGEGYKFFLKFIFPKFKFTNKRFILITDEWTSNYYHWHTFSLIRLYALIEQNLAKDSLLFLPKIYQKYPFVLPSLKKFGIKEQQIVYLRRKSNIKVKNLSFPITTRHHPQLLSKVRDTMINNTKLDLDLGDKIYISRTKRILRNVENEDKVMEVLQKYGFKKVVMENYSYDEQISIINHTKYLIGPHGAGMLNIMFLPKDATALELATTQINTDHTHNRDFYVLSKMLGHKYFYQYCDYGQHNHICNFHCGNINVDLSELEKNVKLMLNGL